MLPIREMAAWSAASYFPPVAQKQAAINKQRVVAKPYAGYFSLDMEIPTSAARALQHGPMKAEEALTPSEADLNRLISEDYHTPDQGYAVLEGLTTYVQSRVVMPGVTTEVFRWWFTWHPLEHERYTLWFPHAHIANSVADPSRLADTSLTYEERLYGNPNRVRELVGSNELDINIRFMAPEELGFDPKRLAAAGFTASASGLVGHGDHPDAVMSMMVHLARDTNAGLELISRYWIGGHPALRRFPGSEHTLDGLKAAGFNEAIVLGAAYELALHDTLEFNHLAKILPLLHARFA